MRPRRWLLLGLLAAAAAVLILALPAVGQTAPKGNTGDARCLSCHAAEGMTYVTIGKPTLSQVGRGDEFNVTFSILTPWKHHLEKNSFSLNLSQAPGLSFVGGEAPVVTSADGSVEPGGMREHVFSTTSNTTELHVTALFAGGPLPAGETRFLRLVAPGGRPFNSTDGAQVTYNAGGAPAVHLAGEDLIAGGTGEWKAIVIRQLRVASPVPLVPGGPSDVAYEVTMGVYGNVTGVNEIYVQGAPRINEGESTSFTFALKAAPDMPSGARILYKVRTTAIADVPTDHPDGHPADMQDVGLWVQWDTLPPIQAGEETVQGGAVLERPTSSDLYPLMRAWSYAVGYGSTFLVIPALVLGGTFGRGTVTWLNKVSLGARRRVLWHNASSFGLLAFGLAHMLLFLLEPAKNWTIGMLWGGSAIACLILLGVTGAMQRRFVERWGFATWRYMHFGISTLMVAFILLHLGLDGTNFKFVRDAFGA